jgi:hypothetical protein
VTPFQEQGLLRQLKALRSTPLREGFETELLERLEPVDVGDERPSPPSARRGRGKLILLAAIFVPFAAAASELAWRALHSIPARSQLAEDVTTVVNQPFVPSRNAMLEPDIVKQLAKATKKPDFEHVDIPEGSQQTVARAAARSKPAEAKEQLTSVGASRTSVTPSNSKAAQNSPPIERLAPNWNSLRAPGASSVSGLQPSQTSLRLTPAASPAAAAENHAVERRSETRAGERHGNGAGEERDQHRERMRQGQ